MNKNALAKILKSDEGFMPHAYPDHLGYTTIGYGRMIDKRLGGGITEDEADYLLANDIAKVCSQIDKEFPWSSEAPDGVRMALACMAFQMGIKKLKGFANTLKLLKEGRYDVAADNAMQSLWARQTPARAKRVTDMMRN